MREMVRGGGKTGFHTSLEPHRRPRPAIQEGSETKRDARRIPLRDRASSPEGANLPGAKQVYRCGRAGGNAGGDSWWGRLRLDSFRVGDEPARTGQ